MADEAALEEAQAEEKKSGNILIPILGSVLVSVLLSVGATVGGLYAAGVFDDDTAPAVDDAGSPVDPAVGPSMGVEVIPLKKFTANLKDGSGGRKISLDISLEGSSEDGKSTLEEVIAEKEASIRDTVNFLLMDFTYAELRGTDGMLRLRDEIHRRIDVKIEGAGVSVDRIYFTDVVVQ